MPDMPHPAAAADIFLVHARWMSDYHRARSRDVQSRAVALLGFTGVLTGLLPVVFKAVSDLPGQPPSATRPALCVAAALLFASAFCSLQAVRVRKGPSTKIDDVRDLWRDALGGKLKHHPETAFTEWFLHGHEAAPSPLQGESDEAERRAKWLARAAYALGFAVLVVLSLTVLLVLEGT